MIISSGEYAPMRLCGIMRLLHEKRSCTADEVESLMHPRSVWSNREIENDRPSEMVARNLALAEDLQLIERRDDGQFLLSSDLPKDCTADYERFLYVVAHRLIGKDALGAEDCLQRKHQFSTTVAWLLAQPASDLPGRPEDLTDREAEFTQQDFKPMGGGVVANQFFLWGAVLGLFQSLSLPSGQQIMLLDPSHFLRRHLDDLIPPGEWTPMSACVRRLGSEFPVFETGWIRERVRPWGDQVLSDSLSLALDRLRRDGELELDFQADAGDGEVFRLGSGLNEQITRLRRKERRSR